MRDYLAAIFKKPEDAGHHGVKGMRWGIVRSDAQISNDTQKRHSSGEKVTPSAKAKAAVAHPTHNPDGSETSATRYARLSEQVKAGNTGVMSEPDLRFFNARTEALAKVNKLNEKNPSWLTSTSKKVLQQAAQNTMQSIADGVAKKYISGPLLEALPDASALRKN